MRAGRAWVALAVWVVVAPWTGVAAGDAIQDVSRPQWMREFFTQEVAPGSITSMAVGADGEPWGIAGEKLIHKKAGKWETFDGVAKPRELVSVPAKKPELLVAGSDGLWVVDGEKARQEGGSPAGVDVLANASGGDVWAIVNVTKGRGVFGRTSGWKKVLDLDSAVGEVRAICRLDSGVVLVLGDKGLFRGGAGKPLTAIKSVAGGLLSDDVAQLAAWGDAHAMLLTSRGLSVTNGAGGWLNCTGREGLPIEALKCVSTDGASVWLGTDQGVVLWRGGKFTYFAGMRWLPDDRVTAIAVARDGAWVATAGGISHIFQKPMSLAEKADAYQKLIDGRPRRLGFVTVMHSLSPGDFTHGEQEISDNDGLWTAMYVAAECFRYAATHSDDARAHARKSMQALLRLESITGISGFPARAISNIHDPAHERRSGGQWNVSPVEKDWMWKGDTSSDEIVGHFLAYYLYSKLVADDAEKAQIRQTCKRVIDHIIDHGYYLIDITGKPTTWGYWSPDALNDTPNGDRGLNSLEILSHLRIAIELLGEERYKTAYRDLIEKHHYALNTVRLRPADGSGANHSDDELAFLSYYPLLMLETDPALRAIYLASLRRTWEGVRPEACPLWNFIYGACSGDGTFDGEAAVEALHEIPLDLVHWHTANGRRADLKLDLASDRFARRQTLRPLPWTDRPLHKWNGNPYEVDGGNSVEEEDPTFWLLPYWMGRYYGYIN